MGVADAGGQARRIGLSPARKTWWGKSPQVPSPIWSTNAGTGAPLSSVRVKLSASTPVTGFEKDAFTTTSW